MGSSLSIDLNCNTADEINKFRASFTTTALKNLIEPLHLLHSFQFAYITGPLDEKYKSDLCLSICKEAPSFQESSLKVLHKVQGLKALGTQRNMTYYRQAISTYNTVMTELKDRCSRLDWATQARIGANTASIADLRVHNAYTNLVFMLRTNLATSHFQIGQYWQARKWSEHAMEIVNERWNPLAINYQADPRYLKALLFNARSNNKLGRWKEAVYSMEKAVEIAPSRTKELELFKGDEKRHAEKQLKTVKRFW